MKKILFLLLLLPLALSAQDTIYVTEQGGNYFVVQKRTQANGSYVESAQLIGTVEQLYDYTQGTFARAASQLKQAADVVLIADRYWAQAIAEDDAFYKSFGIRPMTAVQQSTDSTFLMDTYALQIGAAASGLTFTRDDDGRLQVSVNGGATKLVHLVNSCMRIEDFTVAGAMNLYQVQPGLWVNAERTHVIMRVVQKWLPYSENQD
jgi:hypothetical protein